MNLEQVVRPICYLSDVELPFEEELNDLEAQLSQEEEKVLKEIVESENSIEKPDFMDDLFAAIKKELKIILML